MKERKQILVADDEVNLRRVLAAQLQRDGFDVFTVGDGEEAIAALGEHHIDVLITDLRMPKLDGMRLLAHCSAEHPDLPVVMITAHGTVDTAVEALKLGAFDYVTKPFDRTEFRNVVEKAARTRELNQINMTPTRGAPGRYRIIGQSPEMNAVYDIIEKVADTPSTVLITGESGTGKELIARALHENSARVNKPYVRVNCAAIPPDLIESELFGYEKGAFTGATTRRDGRFAQADGGTLFLDEIAEIPLHLQVKLLRVLQEGEIEPLGGKLRRVDIRLVAATNKDLRRMVEAGRFREDLYYRLNVIAIEVPPLRQRLDDVPLLVDHFLSRFREKNQKLVTGISRPALEVLSRYHYPGNVRELENAIERAVVLCRQPIVDVEDLPQEIRSGGARLESAGHAGPPRLSFAIGTTLDEIERTSIRETLHYTKGDKRLAAQLLGIATRTIYRKLDRGEPGGAAEPDPAFADSDEPDDDDETGPGG